MYKLFDARIDKYEVYKVHTINDSFMIASGIPGQVAANMGDRHGSEIGTLALDLLAGSALFVIPHRPKERLLLRVGVHTGSVIAGIQSIEDKMPRYRLFGDTVQIVSKLTALGERKFEGC